MKTFLQRTLYQVVFFLGASNVIYSQSSASFMAPDTVCVNQSFSITNTSTNASTYYWNFCSGNYNTEPITTNLGTFNNTLKWPVYTSTHKVGGNYYVFVTNNFPSGITRLDYGSSLLNTPSITTLGGLAGIIPDNYLEDIYIQEENGNWYGIVIGGWKDGNPPNQQERIVKLNFGTDITNNNPIAVNMGNMGGLYYPKDLEVFEDGGNYYGYLTNYANNTITRLEFNNSINNTPIATNLGNIGNLNGPGGISLINYQNNWYGYIVNEHDHTYTRLDFNNSLLTTPTATNLGNPDNLTGLSSIKVFTECGGISGFITDGTSQSLGRLKFPNGPTGPINTILDGNITNSGFSYPHSIERFRVKDTLYVLIPNAHNNTITRLAYVSCTNSSIPSSFLQTPPSISYDTPGVYDITLTTDETLITESSACKQVVVLGTPTISVNSVTVCMGSPSTLTATGADSYSWSPSTGLNQSVGATVIANPTITTTYTVTGTNANGCIGITTSVVEIANDSLCGPSCGGSIDLNSPSAAVHLPDNIEYYSTNGFTWESWFKLNDTVSENDFRPIIAGVDGVLCEDNMLSFGWGDKAAKRLIFKIDGEGGCASNGGELNANYPEYYPTNGFSVGTWYHAAGVMDYQNATMKLFVNGQLVDTRTNVVLNTYTRAVPTTLGYDDPSINAKLSVDEVRIWNRVRTDAEILANYNQCVNAADPYLQVYYKCNQNGGTVALDASPYHSDGTLSNSAAWSIDEPAIISQNCNHINASVSVNSEIICKGNSATLNATGATSYTWAPSVGLNATNGATVIATPAVTTTYTVTGTTTCGIMSAVSVVTVIDSPPVAVNNATVCLGSSIMLTATGADSYSWSPLTGLNQSVGATVIASPTITTTYTVTGTNTNGCTSTTTSVVEIANDSLCGPTCSGSVNLDSLNAAVRFPVTNQNYSSNGFTWECWVKLNKDLSQNNDTRTLINFSDQVLCEDIALGFGWFDPAMKDHLIFTVDGPNECSGNNNVINDYIPSGGFVVGTWYHVAGSMDYGNHISKLYLNGQLVNSITNNALPITRVGITEIGWDVNTKVGYPEPPSAVNVDEARIWNRVRTDAEILANYNQCLNGIADSNLLSYYKFNQSAGTVALDASTYHNDGTLNSYAKWSVDEPAIISQNCNNINVSANSELICKGNSATLNATGATSYTWAPSVGLNTTSGATVIATPSVTTTYTVTGTATCGIMSAVSVVTVIDPPTVTVNNATICMGSSATLTATGADSYSWESSSLDSINTTAGPVVIVTPTITTTYTVTGVRLGNELVYNGDFSLGNSGFTNDYNYVAFANPGNYFVGNDYFNNSVTPAYPDRTSPGIGKYGSFDGAPVIGRVWEQTINTIEKNKLYKFSFWATRGLVGASEHFEVHFIGDVTGDEIVSSEIAIETQAGNFIWDEYSKIVWNSTGNNTVTIRIKNLETAINGNDFAIDDISLREYNCKSDAVSIVTVLTTPTVTVSGSDTICTGSSAILTASGSNSYSWLPATGLSSTTSATVIATPTLTTTYTVTGTNSCGTNSDTVTVFVKQSPTVFVNHPQICEGQIAELIAGGADTYSWSAGVTTTGINTGEASPVISTTYTVTGTKNGCSKSALATVTVKPAPNIIVNSVTICKGESATLTATGAYTYQWSTGATTNAITVTPSTTTSYTVTGKSQCCACAGNVIVATVTVKPLPVVTVNSLTVCFGDTAYFEAFGADTYVWSLGATAIGPNTAIASPGASTSYTVTGYINGCSSTAISNVTVPFITVNSATICQGQTVILTANGAASYAWSNGATTSSINVSPFTTTSYTVVGAVKNCIKCNASAIGVVTVNPKPNITVSSVTICKGSSVVLTATGTNAISYSWSPATGLNTTTGASVVANPTVTTIYTITSTSAAGCISTTTATVTVSPKPDITVSSATICSGSSVVLTATGTNAMSYSWSPATGLNTTTGISVVANPTVTTTYTIIAASSAGCTATTAATVTVKPGPVVTISGKNTYCQGEQILLTASAGDSYQWYVNNNPITGGSQQTNTYIPSGTGNFLYAVTVYVNGCSATKSITVTVKPNPVVTITGPSAVCAGNTVTMTAHGADSYTWIKGGSGTANPYTDLPSCDYDYQVIGTTGGCSGNSNIIHVSVRPTPIISISSAIKTNPYCQFNCFYTLTATGAGTGGSYTWYRASTPTGPWTSIGSGQTITVLGGSYFSVVGTDINGCDNRSGSLFRSADDSFTVNPEAIIDLSNVDKEVVLFPNPNNGNMTLGYNMEKADKGVFTIYGMLGQTIAVYPLDGTNTLLQINNDQLSNGTYVYSVVINGNEIKRDKIVIVK